MSKDKPLLGKKIDTWFRKEVFMLDYEGENEDLRSEEEKRRSSEEYKRQMDELMVYKREVIKKNELEQILKREERIEKKEKDDWKRKKVKDGASGQSFSEYTEKKEKWKMRKSTFLTLGIILGFPFLMSLCDSGKDRDRSYDDYYERIQVERARGVRDL